MQTAQQTWKYIPKTQDPALEPAWLFQNTKTKQTVRFWAPDYISPYYYYLPIIMLGSDQRCSE